MTRPMILLNPGPANTTPTVKQAMTVPDICPREAKFGDLLLDVRARLTRVVHAGDRYTAVLFCGSGTAGVEAAVSSAVPDGGRLLVVDNGAYGARIAAIANAYGISHDHLQLGVGAYPDPAQIAAQLEKQTYTHLAIIHHETSTGMLNPVGEVAAVCRARGVEVIVDAMSSYAGLPIDIETLGADYLISSSNKCIQGMAGLSFVICSKQRLEQMQPVPGRSYYLNLVQQHRYLEDQKQMQFTPPVQIVYALHQALDEYFEETAQGRYRRYMANWEALDAGVRGIGFRRLLPESQLSHILTAYLEPDHPSYSFEQLHDMLYERGFTIYPGKGANRSTFRLANMGAVSADDMRDFVDELRTTVTQMGLNPLYSAKEPHAP